MELHDYGVPTEDRAAFVKFMALVARADGRLADEEVRAIESAMEVWELTGAEAGQVRAIMASGAALNTLAGSFSHAKSGYLLIQELVTVAHLDGQYDEAERNAIVEIATTLKISPDRVEAIEGWVRDGIQWRARGLTLVQPEEM